MKLWVDAQLSPALAPWLSATFGIEAVSVSRILMRDATDAEIFWAARAATAAVMTKDRDFLEWVDRFGSPPQVLWITAGNTSNARMREILLSALPDALALLVAGEPLVEIADASAVLKVSEPDETES